MPYTVQELAEKCSITNAYVLRYIRKNDLAFGLEKQGRAYTISDDVAQILLDHFAQSEVDKVDAKTNVANDDLVQVLKQQIEAQQKQLEAQAEQILRLTETVQDLTATNKALAQAEVKRMFTGVSRSNEIILADAHVIETTNQEQAQQPQQTEKKKGFWARLFGR